MKCDSCSADVSPDMLHCEFCGSYVERGAPNGDPLNASPQREIFARIRSSAQFQAISQGRRIRQRLLTHSWFAPDLTWVLSFVLMICITIATAFLAGFLSAFPLVIAISCGYMVLDSGFKNREVVKSPATPVPAIVVTKRVEMRGENQDIPFYFAQFHFESGVTNELPIWDPQQFDRLIKADPGYLIRRTKNIAEFHSVEI